MRDPIREYLTIPAFAQLMGRSVQAVYRDVAAGRLPVLRLGRRVFIDLVALERLREREIERVARMQAGDRVAA